jgi:transglutaminase-like putative cysteine protease
MSGKAIDYLRRINAPREIEDSWQLRIAVWAAVSISIFALALQGVTSTALVAASIALIALGSFMSWRRRYRPNLAIKMVIMLLTVAALVSFLRQVFLQPYDPRVPLAELFVWVQVLHSFDLPRGKDLLLALVSSLILVALAGSFSLSASFGLVILVWLMAALPALYFIQQSRLHAFSTEPDNHSTAKLSAWRLVAVMITLVVVVSMSGLALGAFMPRINATYLRSLPFSVRRSFASSDGYQFMNPAYPGLPFSPPETATEINPEGYFGFGTYLDLRSRGTLIDLPVMRVRSTEPAYWSGLAFWEYNGYAWVTPDEEPQRLYASVQPFSIEYDPTQAHLSSHTVIQTYYLEAEQPSVIFASYRPDLLYYPSDFVYQDESGLKSPFPLSEGLVYSVVSSSIGSESRLSTSRREVREGTLLPYLELPPMPERVQELADEIIPRGEGPYARAQAIEDFLKNEYEYSLDVPALPPGEDAVDFFLFEHRRGYCEHFATAYAVLCRMAGIPSRVVTGYSTGDYNPFTGLYEVSLDDAHAWVEIYLEGIGWVTREPTPGFSMPESGQASGALWIFQDFFSWVGRNLSALLPGPLRSALKTGLAAVASAASALVEGFLYSVSAAPWLLLLLFLVLSILPLVWVLRRLRRANGPPPAVSDGPLLAMRDFMGALDSLGIARGPSQTAGEFFGGLSAMIPGLNLSCELLLFERARYGKSTLGAEDAGRLRHGLTAALEQIELTLRARSRKRRANTSKNGT